MSYRLLSSRSADGARTVLDDFTGVAISDGYKAYDTLARERESSDLTLAHRWAHVRRKFVEAEPHYPEAGEMADRIGQLYAIEAEAKRASPEERPATLAALRAKQSKLVLEEIRAYRAFAEAAEDPSLRYKFRALEQLELETKEKLRTIVERTGGPTAENTAHMEAGEKLAEGRLANLEDWRAAMRQTVEMIEPNLREFEQLAAGAPAEDADVMAHLVAHEQAQVTFATREAEGDAGNSIDAVVTLLSNPPERG